MLVVHLGLKLSDLSDGADQHHSQWCSPCRVQLGDAASKDAAGATSLPLPRRTHTVQPDRRLHSTHGRRPSADAFASMFDGCNPAELGSSMLASSSMSRAPVCTPVVVVAAWEQLGLGLDRNLEYGV